MGLQLRHKRRKRISHTRVPMPVPTTVNERWSMDFMSDCLDNGKRFRVLTVVDVFSRECPLLAAGLSLTAQRVIVYLEKLRGLRGLPKMITVDNGSEFISKKMDAWAYYNGIKLDFIRPGKPTENAFIESFNGRLRDECLNAQVFNSTEDAQEKLESWRLDYNTNRPHSSIGNLPPSEFVERFKKEASKTQILNLQMV